jgi:hypothetical protein
MVLIRLSKRSSNPMGSIKTDLDKSEPRGKRALLILRKSCWRLWSVKVVVLDQKNTIHWSPWQEVTARCSASEVCYSVTQGVYIYTSSLHTVRMTGPLTFLVRCGMKLKRTLCVFQFGCTWSIYTFYTTANTPFIT